MKTTVTAPVRTSEAPPPGLSLGDLYYIFFRHKWKILLIFLAGVLGSVAYYFVKPPLYQSQAKILIRYIVEGKTATSAKDEAQMRPLDSGGANIINSEIEILTSLDLAALVADAVGPEKILAKLGGGNDRLRAAGVIRGGLTVEIPNRSTVLLITFRHRDAAVVQPVLGQLVGTYLKRHVEIHQGVGVLDGFFSRQADLLLAQLSTTEASLKKLKAETQVISLDESKRDCMDRIAKIRQELLTAEAELAERRTMLGEQGKLLPATISATNTGSVVTPRQSEQYLRACRELEALQQQLAGVRAKYTDEHFQVRNLLALVGEAESWKQKLEGLHPQLTRLAPLPAPDASHGQIGFDLTTESSRVAALEAKIKVLASQLETVRTEASRVMDAEPELTQLQRKKESEENSLRYYTLNLDEARRNESLGSGKITNISELQTPSPPIRDMKGVMKPMLVILFIGCFGGLGLGFVSERILDRTIKCVADVERQVRVPLFMSVPDTGWKSGFRLPRLSRNGHQPPLPVNGTGTGKGALPNGEAGSAADTAVAPWSPQHVLRPYFEGLRDRLITYFEVREMHHKPKLVAVTSYNRRAGVTTMAAGLAAALSETGDGNVLLVDMNLEQGAAHAFHQGKLSCGLSEALENDTRDPALVRENLYLVSAQEADNQKLPRMFPKRFAHLVPRMKASDYDYIIFDMPPVTQTSLTARLSGFMDMVLVVIESEKTGQEIVQRANGLLQESRANVAAILNKHRAYVPQKFSQEL